MNNQQLKAMRHRHGLSQSKAAALVHVTQRTWSRYESGAQTIPPGVIELFCMKLGEKFEG